MILSKSRSYSGKTEGFEDPGFQTKQTFRNKSINFHVRKGERKNNVFLSRFWLQNDTMLEHVGLRFGHQKAHQNRDGKKEGKKQEKGAPGTHGGH